MRQVSKTHYQCKMEENIIGSDDFSVNFFLACARSFPSCKALLEGRGPRAGRGLQWAKTGNRKGMLRPSLIAECFGAAQISENVFGKSMHNRRRAGLQISVTVVRFTYRIVSRNSNLVNSPTTSGNRQDLVDGQWMQGSLWHCWSQHVSRSVTFRKPNLTSVIR